MFTNCEINLISEHFTITKVTYAFIEFYSHTTEHYWILKKISNPKRPIQIYHKHSFSDPYYHKHYLTFTIKSAIFSIQQHDQYVLSTIKTSKS